MNELSELLSDITGHQIGYQPMSLDEFAETYKDSSGEMLASMYEGGALGLLNEVSGDFEQIIGRKATDLETFLKQYIQTL